jgi:hypothetical protein
MPTPRITRTPLDVKNATRLSINQDSGRIFITNFTISQLASPVQLQALEIDGNGNKTYSRTIPLPLGSAGICPVEDNQFVLFQNINTCQAVLFDAGCEVIEPMPLPGAKNYPSVHALFDPDNRIIMGIGFAEEMAPTDVFFFDPYKRAFFPLAAPFTFDFAGCMAYDKKIETLLLGNEYGTSVYPFDLTSTKPKGKLDIKGYDIRAFTVTDDTAALGSEFIVGGTPMGKEPGEESGSGPKIRTLVRYDGSDPSKYKTSNSLGTPKQDVFTLVNNEQFVYVIDIDGIQRFLPATQTPGPYVELASGTVELRPEAIMDKARNRIHLLNTAGATAGELLTIDCATMT